MRSPKLRPPGVVVLGDINIDILARIEKFPAPGEDCLAPQLEMHCGGVGANTALALARWGVPVRLLGSVGRDAFGELALRFLRAGQVDVTQVAQRDRAATGLMFIAVTADGQRTIFGSRGANAELQGPPTEAGGLEDAQAVHLVGYNFLSPSVAELAGRLIEEARRHGRQVSLDVGMAPSRQIPQKILQVAGKVDILFAGLDEAAALTGEPDKASAFDALERSGAREVVMKLGEKGCLFRESGALKQAPSFRVPVADTTGAGDAFAAAFLWARLRGWAPAAAALLADAAGAAAACVVGAGEGIPAPRQVLRLLRESRLDAEWEAVRVRLLEQLRVEFQSEDAGRTSGGWNEASA